MQTAVEATRPGTPMPAFDPATVPYRFAHWKDASWNSFQRQAERYATFRSLLGSNLTGAEIGVYKGGFGEFLLGHCRKLYLVDPWFRAGGFWNSGIAGDSRVQTVIDIMSAYKAEIEARRVEVVVEYAVPFLRSMPDGSFDFLYLDASHEYSATLDELHAAQPKLKSGGHMFGDDYDPDPASKQHGVYRAVNEFARDTGATFVINESRQWGLSLPPA
jgi:hypothetical protein